MAASLIAQIGIPAILKGLAEALRNVNAPAAQGAGAALEEVLDSFRSGKLTPEQMAEVNRHMERIEELEAEERKTGLQQVNESLRAEVASADLYVRRMRPTFGYIIALTWGAQMLALAYVIVFDTREAGLVIEAMSNLGTIWTIGLSVLGIYVYKRSAEKQAGFRFSPPSSVAPEAPSAPRSADSQEAYNS